MTDDAPAPGDAEREARAVLEEQLRALVFNAIAAGVGNSLNEMAARLDQIGEAAIRKIDKLELEVAQQAVAIAELKVHLAAIDRGRQHLAQGEQRRDLN
jgi:hypothetical protein